MICWNCREPVEGLVCAGCGVLQPPRPDLDHFALLGLPRRWSFGPREVDDAWKAVSRKTHPDRFVGKRAVERRFAQQWTSRAHEARDVLKAPLRRALYLATGEADLSDKRGPDAGADFLEEVFELQMAARMGEEGVGDRVEAMVAATTARIDEVMNAWEQSAAALDEVPVLVARLRYLDTARALVLGTTSH